MPGVTDFASAAYSGGSTNVVASAAPVYEKQYPQEEPAQASGPTKIMTIKPPSAVMESIHESQLVSILVTSQYKNEILEISAPLQNPVSMNAISTWEGFSMSDWSESAKKAMPSVKLAAQVGFGASAVSTMGTRRRWTGSSPLDFQIELLFQAYDDAFTDVVVPAIRLQMLPLPRRSAASALGVDFFLIPPGPSPYPDNFVGKIKNGVMGGGWDGFFESSGENIAIKIGGLIALKRVIVEKCAVVWDEKCDKGGVPISAKVTLFVSTWEVLTREALLESVLKGRST